METSANSLDYVNSSDWVDISSKDDEKSDNYPDSSNDRINSLEAEMSANSDFDNIYTSSDEIRESDFIQIDDKSIDIPDNRQDSSNDRKLDSLKVENTKNYDLPLKVSPANSSEEPIDESHTNIVDRIDNFDVVRQHIADEKEESTDDKSDHNDALSPDGPDHNKVVSSKYKVTPNKSDTTKVTAPNSQDVPESNKRKGISYWIKRYAQLLIGAIGGCLLTVLVVVPAVYVSTKSNCETDIAKSNIKTVILKSNDTTDCTLKCVNTTSNNYLKLKFKQSTLHHSAYISDDGLALSNTYSKHTSISSVHSPSSLSKYPGIIGNICLDTTSKIYFEVQYEFSVIDDYNSYYKHIFEVGLAEHDQIDNYYQIGSTRLTGWSYYLARCNYIHYNVCLKAQHNGKDVNDPLTMHDLSLGSKHSGKLGFVVNMSQEKFSILPNLSTEIPMVYSFKDVFSNQRLCPFFGVFNPNSYEVNLTLSNTYDFSDAVWNTVFI